MDQLDLLDLLDLLDQLDLLGVLGVFDDVVVCVFHICWIFDGFRMSQAGRRAVSLFFGQGALAPARHAVCLVAWF